MVNILDQVSIRMPCHVCGQAYEVPLRDVLLSHTVVQCGCPVTQETECPPVFQVKLFDREPVQALETAWKQVADRARVNGGELVVAASGLCPPENKSERKNHMSSAGDHAMKQQEHTQPGRIRQPVPTSGTLLNFDIAAEVRRLQAEQPWQAEHTANTIVKYPDLRVVLVALKAGGRLHEHRTPGRLSIQSLSGEMRVHAEGQVIEMQVGSLLTLDHDVPHDVEATSDSVFLLTIAWPEPKPNRD
jgi:quercetin dioxygenase-like cupin family protein